MKSYECQIRVNELEEEAKDVFSTKQTLTFCSIELVDKNKFLAIMRMLLSNLEKEF